MPVRLGAASQQPLRVGAAQVQKMYLGSALVYSLAVSPPPTPDPPSPDPDPDPPVGDPPPPATPPTSVVASAQNASALVSWTLPTTYSGEILTHTVQQSSDVSPSWVAATGAVSAEPSALIQNLTNGVTYRFRVATVTTAGSTPYSTPSNSARPVGGPGAPQEVTATRLGDGCVAVQWLPPSDTGGALESELRYTIQQGTGEYASVTWQTLASSHTSTTLLVCDEACDTDYWYRVSTVTPSGQSEYSAGVLVEAGSHIVPKEPYLHEVTAGAGFLRSAWMKPIWSAGGCDAADTMEIWIRKQQHSSDTTGTLLSQYSLHSSTPLTYNPDPESRSLEDRKRIYITDIDGLEVGARYFIAARATNAAGQGPHKWVLSPPVPSASSGLIEMPDEIIAEEACGAARLYVQIPDWWDLEDTRLDSWRAYGDFLNPRTYPVFRQLDASCSEGLAAVPSLGCSELPDTLYRCRVGPYARFHFFDLPYRLHARNGFGSGPATYLHVTGTRAEWNLQVSPVVGETYIFYARGGDTSARISVHGINKNHCVIYPPAGYPSTDVTDYLIEYRTASVSATDGYARGSGAWIPAVLDPDPDTGMRTVTGLPTNTVLEFRVRAENAYGLGAPSLPFAVRMSSSGATAAAALNGSGKFRWDANYSWSQPVTGGQNDNMNAGRFFTVAHPCLMRIVVSSLAPASSGGQAILGISTSDSSGNILGFAAGAASIAAVAQIVTFFAKPGFRYAVEAWNTAETSLALSAFTEDAHDYPCAWRPAVPPHPVFIEDDRPFLESPRLNPDASNGLAPSRLRGTIATYPSDDSFYIQANRAGRVRFSLSGTQNQYNIWVGTAAQPRAESLTVYRGSEGSFNETLAAGERITFAPKFSSSPAATLQYAIWHANLPASLSPDAQDYQDIAPGDGGASAPAYAPLLNGWT